MKTLQKNKKTPKIVEYAAAIVNNAFPEFEDEAKALAKNLNFQPDLEFIYNQHSKSQDPDLVEEVTNLFTNFNENQNENKTEKIIQKTMRQLRKALNQENEKEVNDYLI